MNVIDMKRHRKKQDSVFTISPEVKEANDRATLAKANFIQQALLKYDLVLAKKKVHDFEMGDLHMLALIGPSEGDEAGLICAFEFGYMPIYFPENQLNRRTFDLCELCWSLNLFPKLSNIRLTI